jgi:hypothetical protein
MAIKKSNFACVYMRNISQYDSGERCGPWASNVLIIFKKYLPRADNSSKKLYVQKGQLIIDHNLQSSISSKIDVLHFYGIE